ncbi:MAG: efflux RND transporter periplasmic adaptor subunit [Brevinema sp.]
MTKKKLIILIAVFLVGGILFFRNKSSNKNTKRENNLKTTVLVRSAKANSLKKFLDLYGEIKAENEVELTSPVTGKVLRFNRLEGESVRRSQPVVSIDRFEVGARYAAAPVLSPVSGVVTRILVSEGADVTVGTSVAVVGNIDRLEALIQVPENLAPEVKVGQLVYFKSRSIPDRIFEGKIIRRDLSLNPATRSLTVRATIPNKDHDLFSGIFAESFVFVEEATNVFVFPESSVTKTKEGLPAVFVNQDGRAVLRPVTIALQYRDQIAISEGLEEGEEVIVFGREYLSEGVTIQVIREDAQEDTTSSIPQDNPTNNTKILTETNLETQTETANSN